MVSFHREPGKWVHRARLTLLTFHCDHWLSVLHEGHPPTGSRNLVGRQKRRDALKQEGRGISSWSLVFERCWPEADSSGKASIVLQQSCVGGSEIHFRWKVDTEGGEGRLSKTGHILRTDW